MDTRKSQGDGQLAAAEALQSRVGRPRRVDREAVIDAALDLLQREGLGAVTMRRIAEQVGAGIATVYAAAGSKQDVLLAAVDHVLSGFPEPSGAADPWDALHELWTATHELLMAHPAVAQLSALQPVPGHGVQRVIDATLSLLAAGNVAESEAWTGYLTLRSYTVGFTLLKISRTAADSEDAASSLDGQANHGDFEKGLDVLLRGLRPRI